jgi:hypothetical protein
MAEPGGAGGVSARVVVKHGIVVEAAPILRCHVVRLDGPTFKSLCCCDGWRWEMVDGSR